MIRRFLLTILGIVLIALGLLALTFEDVGVILVIFPAYPLALLSTWINPSARSGLLWDSAHSPPYLNPLGIAVIYFLPGVALVLWGVVARSKR